MSKPCKWCKSTEHTQFLCRQKPRTPIKRSSKPIAQESKKARAKRRKAAAIWFEQNPPDENGEWTCYLQISYGCFKQLTRNTLSLEHVKPKVKAPELKYEPSNIRPSCPPCNKLKGSQTLEVLVRRYPHLIKYI